MLYDNKKWIEDIDKVIEVVPELDDLAGKSLMITGAAGLVCSAVVDIIFRYAEGREYSEKNVFDVRLVERETTMRKK